MAALTARRPTLGGLSAGLARPLGERTGDRPPTRSPHPLASGVWRPPGSRESATRRTQGTMRQTDVLVVGAGPAGLAVAGACGRLGLTTAVVDPAPERPWTA